MASGAARAVSMVAVILGIPALCGGGMLYYGKVLSEAQVAEGSLRTPEETRRMLEEMERRFRAMTPAEHLAEARRQLDCNYDPATRMGGNPRAAQQHLDAIPAGVEAAGVAEVRAEMARREAARAEAVARKIGELASRPITLEGEAASLTGDPRRAAIRRRFACHLDHFGASQLGCVHTDAPDDTTLRFDHGACNASMIDRHVLPAHRPALRALGFTKVRCRNGSAEVGL